MSDKIKILRTRHCDTRSMDDKDITIGNVYNDTIMHVIAVNDVARAMAVTFLDRVGVHDWTKYHKDHLKDFYDAIKSGKTGDEFKQQKWYQDHIHLERHHPADNCVDDINLLDILEMCIDVVVACKARDSQQRVFTPEISDEVLRKALDNTYKLISDSVEVVEGYEAEEEIINHLTGKKSKDKISEDDIVDIVK